MIKFIIATSSSKAQKNIKNVRKPKNGLIETAIYENNLNRNKTIMIGDKITDLLAAKRSKISFYFKKNYNFLSQIKKIIRNENIKNNFYKFFNIIFYYNFNWNLFISF